MLPHEQSPWHVRGIQILDSYWCVDCCQNLILKCRSVLIESAAAHCRHQRESGAGVIGTNADRRQETIIVCSKLQLLVRGKI
jgi:hypothetical protein